MVDIRRAVEKNGKSLPAPPDAVGSYEPTIASGNLLFISGQLPLKEGVLLYKGQVGKDLSVDQGYAAAELCALNMLSQVDRFVRTTQRALQRIVKIEGFINCSPAFEQHAQVLNGASILLAKVLLEKAGHVRAVTGCTSLPLGAAVELVATVEID